MENKNFNKKEFWELMEESDRQGLEYLYANEIKYYRKTDRGTYIKILYDVVDTLNFCQMIYETNIDFFDTMQIANFDNRYPFEIRPLTNRELILYAMNRYPVVDSATRREKLLTKKEMIEAGTPEELVKHNFEITQEKLEEIFNQPTWQHKMNTV